jgi:hypothetical protein
LLGDSGRRAKISNRLKAYHSRALDTQRQGWRDLLHG